MKKICILLAAVLLMTALVSCGGAAEGPAAASDPEPASSAQQTESQTESQAESQTESQADETQEASAASGTAEAQEFTALVSLEYDFVEFCLPENHDGVSFVDMGANCTVMIDRYGNDVVAYHEYDNFAAIEKKTAGGHTFDYQKFNYLDLPNWRMYVIKIVHNNEYYRFIYNVYAEEYDDAQVEKFMSTIRFADEY